MDQEKSVPVVVPFKKLHGAGAGDGNTMSPFTKHPVTDGDWAAARERAITRHPSTSGAPVDAPQTAVEAAEAPDTARPVLTVVHDDADDLASALEA